MAIDPRYPTDDAKQLFDAPLIDREFDGIQEYDNPVPSWWKWLFLSTIVFSALYFPFHHLGVPGRSAVERYETALGENMRLQFAEIGDLQPNEATLVRMMNDRRWMRVGASVYRAHCASCHGPDGGGLVGPNLTDDHYKNVQTIEDILRIVREGAAGGAMPPWKNRLQPNEQILVSSYVASLRGTSPATARGAEGSVIPPWPEEVVEEAADEVDGQINNVEVVAENRDAAQ
jgi:cytochrome c oxidase cbb3-type subunit III